MKKNIKIWTRDSKLAIWQADFVRNKFEDLWYKTEMIFIKSQWDQDLSTPLYELWIEGIFTKTLDLAVINWEIDLAVHSLKDVPTKLAKGLVIAWIPERWDYRDVLLYKWDLDLENMNYVIWSSSVRRKAFFLNRFPLSKIENLRWNIASRIEKLEANLNWKWAIFANVALERLFIDSNNKLILDFMLPAPAQWALWISCLEDNLSVIDICKKINHNETNICVNIEREFLSLLEWICSMPIWALAIINNDKISFYWAFLSVDWSQKYEVFIKDSISNYKEIWKKAYSKLIENKDAFKLINDFRCSKALYAK